MKKHILALLLPILIFGQSHNYPDTIVTLKNQVYPCRIIKINTDEFHLIFENNKIGKYKTHIAKDIIIKDYGSIYTNENGLLFDLESIQGFIAKRNKKYEEINRLDSLSTIPNPVKNAPIPAYFNTPDKKYSFGFFYSPFNEGRMTIYYGNDIIVTNEFSTKIESQFSIPLKDKLHISLNIIYNSNRIKSRSENHFLRFDPIDQYDYGNAILNSLKIFTIEAGLKYYFTDFIPQHTSAFVTAAIGKKFAFSDNKDKELFEDDPNTDDIKILDNYNEFLEDINAPFLLQIGFGAEYFFNQYLSVHSSIRFYYETIRAKHTVTEKSTYGETRTIFKTEDDEINTHIGFGLNFYF